MQTVIGRLTGDAKIGETKDGRKVVNFTVAENYRYKAKGSDVVTEVVNFYECSYWIGTGIAQYLKKGLLVETIGRVGARVWENKDGESKASLTLHVLYIQLYGKVEKAETPKEVVQIDSNTQDDLPF